MTVLDTLAGIVLFVLVIEWVLVRRLRVGRRTGLDSVLGLGVTAVGAGERAVVSGEPASAFRPRRLIVPSHRARDFLIVGMWTAGAHHLRRDRCFGMGAPALPAEMFSELSKGVLLDMGVVAAGEVVAVEVWNHTERDSVFRGVLVGSLSRSWWEVLLRRRRAVLTKVGGHIENQVMKGGA
jgi:hypothetical protein